MPAFNIQKSPDVKDEDARTIGDWAEAQFESLIADLQTQEVLDLVESFVAPLRPKAGNLAYADGVKWNPGGGEGFYYYDSSGTWQLVTNSAALAATIAALNLAQYMKLAGGQTTTGGFYVTTRNLGAWSQYGAAGSSINFDPANGNYQGVSNDQAMTITPLSGADYALDLLVTNITGAGTISFSGFTVSANTGDVLTTTVGHKFIISIRQMLGISTYVIKALQ